MGDSRKLRFLEASRVGSPAGDLASLQLHTEADEPLGTLDGILIDPSERRVRYLVVERPGWFRTRRYLVPTECVAKVERDRKLLRLDVDPADLHALDEFNRSKFREFSDEDAVDAMFARAS
jgi:hypothetical protein